MSEVISIFSRFVKLPNEIQKLLPELKLHVVKDLGKYYYFNYLLIGYF